MFGGSGSRQLRFCETALRLVVAAALLCAAGTVAQQQHRPMEVPSTTENTNEPAHTRLILKDGSYQLVLSYTVVGNVVHFRSAERDGEEEDIPLALVDLPATEKWKKDHEPGAESRARAAAPVLSPELAREEAARAALMPEIAPDLHLPEEDSVLAQIGRASCRERVCQYV